MSLYSTLFKYFIKFEIYRLSRSFPHGYIIFHKLKYDLMMWIVQKAGKKLKNDLSLRDYIMEKIRTHDITLSSLPKRCWRDEGILLLAIKTRCTIPRELWRKEKLLTLIEKEKITFHIWNIPKFIRRDFSFVLSQSKLNDHVIHRSLLSKNDKETIEFVVNYRWYLKENIGNDIYFRFY